MTTTLRLPAWARNNTDLLTVQGVTTVRDLTLDGNLHNRGPWDEYEQQQSALIEVADGATFTGTDLVLLNSPGDGIVIRDNVTATLTNISATDCFRGGITVTGNNVDVTVVNYQGGGSEAPAYIQMEAPQRNAGHNMNLAVTASTIPKIELEAQPDSIVAVANSIIQAGLSVWANGGGSVTFTDCTIELVDSKFLNEVRHYVDVSFVRCDFTGSRMLLTPETVDYAPAVQRLTFTDCTFTGTGDEAIYNNGAASAEADHLVTFAGTCTYSGFTTGYTVHPGKYGPTSGTLAAA